MTNWNTFKVTLEKYPDLHLQFQYADNRLVDAAYHITEIKQAPITSVDCGGVVNKWTEIVVQLWVPAGQVQEHSMQVSKALSIITVVENALPLVVDAVVKIEYGNNEFDTRQMPVREIIIQNQNLIIDLQPDTVQCKAIERGGSYGTTTAEEACCTPAVKPKLQLVNLVANNNTCIPGGGCC